MVKMAKWVRTCWPGRGLQTDRGYFTQAHVPPTSVSTLLLFAATGPTAIVDPTYRLPSDGLDAMGHKMLATQAGGMIATVLGCAVAWLFKF
jgi:hypothetical protein